MKPISTDLEIILQPMQLREDERKPEPRKKQPKRDYER